MAKKRRLLSLLGMSVLMVCSACGEAKEDIQPEPPVIVEFSVSEASVVDETVTEETTDPVEEAKQRQVAVIAPAKERPQESYSEEDDKEDPFLEAVEYSDSMFRELSLDPNELDKSARILDGLYASERSNVIFSPMSLYMALGMIENGADGETKKALDNFLGGEKYDEIASFIMKRYYDSPDNLDSAEAMNVANSIWVNNKRTIVESFKEKASKTYKAEISNIDMAEPERAANVINDWCNKHTAGKIPSIVGPSNLNEDTPMVLVNTIYFKSPWFNKHFKTIQGDFSDINGVKRDLEVVAGKAEDCYENDKATAFSLVYDNGLRFVGILPKKEGEFSISELDLESLMANDVTSHYSKVCMEMPRLKYETNNKMIKEILSDMDLSIIFDRGEAEFPELVERHVDENTYVDDIVQKCTIELDENGTEASAATAGMIGLSGAMPGKTSEVFEVILNRPFVYMIVEPTTGRIVFFGKVVTI